MRDSRMRDLTMLWCEDLYKKKYGVTYPWSSKEAKLLQRCIAYFDTNFKDESIQKIQKAFEGYLQDEDEFISKEKHSFSFFASKPYKWVNHQIKKNIQPFRHKPREPDIPDDEWKQKMIGLVSDNPVQFTKGYVFMHGLLKKINPERHKWLWDYLKDLLGKDRLTKIYKDSMSCGMFEEIKYRRTM